MYPSVKEMKKVIKRHNEEMGKSGYKYEEGKYLASKKTGEPNPNQIRESYGVYNAEDIDMDVGVNIKRSNRGFNDDVKDIEMQKNKNNVMQQEICVVGGNSTGGNKKLESFKRKTSEQQAFYEKRIPEDFDEDIQEDKSFDNGYDLGVSETDKRIFNHHRDHNNRLDITSPLDRTFDPLNQSENQNNS